MGPDYKTLKKQPPQKNFRHICYEISPTRITEIEAWIDKTQDAHDHELPLMLALPPALTPPQKTSSDSQINSPKFSLLSDQTLQSPSSMGAAEIINLHQGAFHASLWFPPPCEGSYAALPGFDNVARTVSIINHGTFTGLDGSTQELYVAQTCLPRVSVTNCPGLWVFQGLNSTRGHSNHYFAEWNPERQYFYCMDYGFAFWVTLEGNVEYHYLLDPENAPSIHGQVYWPYDKFGPMYWWAYKVAEATFLEEQEEYLQQQYLDQEYLDQEYLDQQYLDQQCLDQQYLGQEYLDQRYLDQEYLEEDDLIEWYQDLQEEEYFVNQDEFQAMYGYGSEEDERERAQNESLLTMEYRMAATNAQYIQQDQFWNEPMSVAAIVHEMQQYHMLKDWLRKERIQMACFAHEMQQHPTQQDKLRRECWEAEGLREEQLFCFENGFFDKNEKCELGRRMW